jgi:hypothetical protein
MTTTDTERAERAERNRVTLFLRKGAPAGALDVCRRLEAEYPGYAVSWSPALADRPDRYAAWCLNPAHEHRERVLWATEPVALGVLLTAQYAEHAALDSPTPLTTSGGWA